MAIWIHLEHSLSPFWLIHKNESRRRVGMFTAEGTEKQVDPRTYSLNFFFFFLGWKRKFQNLFYLICWQYPDFCPGQCCPLHWAHPGHFCPSLLRLILVKPILQLTGSTPSATWWSAPWNERAQHIHLVLSWCPKHSGHPIKYVFNGIL